MRKVILLSALALVIGAGFLRLLQHDRGYVLIDAFGKTIEMRLGFAVVMLMAAVFVIWLLVKLLNRLYHAVFGSVGWLRNRRSRRAEARTHRGLVRYLEGDWRSAKRDLVKGAKANQTPVINYLAAARSAQEMGDMETARALIQKAEAQSNGKDLAVTLSQARLQLSDHKYEQCLATLHRVKTAHPDHPVVLELLYKAYLALKDWRALEALLPELERQRVLSETERRNLGERIYLGLLEEQGKKMALRPDAPDAQLNITELHDLWERIPKKLRVQPVFIEAYVRLLLQAKQDQEAETLLRATLKNQWSQPLIDLYGMVQAPDKTKQLHQVQAWLKDHGSDARLQLACGRIALRNEDWELARKYFLQSLQLNPSSEAYAEIGRLLAYLGEHEQSTSYFQRGFMMASHNLPGLPQVQGHLPT